MKELNPGHLLISHDGASKWTLVDSLQISLPSPLDLTNKSTADVFVQQRKRPAKICAARGNIDGGISRYKVVSSCLPGKSCR